MDVLRSGVRLVLSGVDALYEEEAGNDRPEGQRHQGHRYGQAPAFAPAAHGLPLK